MEVQRVECKEMRSYSVKKLKSMAVVLLLVLPVMRVSAQKAAISTDLVGYVNFVAMNVEVSLPVARHWTVNAAARYSPFEFNLGDGKENARNKQQTYSAGMRWWPWNVYSGWWLSGKLQYQEYNSGGFLSDTTYEGDRVGAGVSGGYSYMLGKHFNIDFGLGLWGGWDKFSKYACPVCGLTDDAGSKFFVLPTDVIIALSYVF